MGVRCLHFIYCKRDTVMKTCFLSIIIPMYKVEKYLEKCIDSIVSQAKEGIELILVDDGSPDNSGIIADKYASRYTYIYSYHKPNGGLSDARNFGIDKSNGKYMWFVDSDDYLEPNSLSKILQCLKSSSPDVLVIQSKVEQNLKLRDERIYTIERGLYSSHDYMEQLKLHPEASIFCAQYQIVRRDFVIDKKIYFYKGILHEDELWTPEILINADSIYYSGLNIYYHVMRDGSIMNSNNFEKSGRADIVLTHELFKIFDESGRDDLIYMRDHAVDTFMQSIWKVPDFLKEENICRSLPIKNSFYMKTKMKAILYFISPKMYLKIHNNLRK